MSDISIIHTPIQSVDKEEYIDDLREYALSANFDAIPNKILITGDIFDITRYLVTISENCEFNFDPELE